MTRIDTVIVAVFAAAACLLAAAGYLYFLVERGLPLQFEASVALAAIVGFVVPAVTATASVRLTKWRGAGAWLVFFTIASLVLAIAFAWLGS